MTNSRFSTIILAGGLSTRMGQDKALLEIQGMPLLQRITDVVLPLSTAVFVVTAWPEHYQLVVSPSCQFVLDRFTEGPIVGFAQGLAHVQTDWVFLLSCDLPNLDQGSIAAWIQNLETISESTMAYLPKGDKGWEPLCGFYRSTCRASIRQFIDQGGRSLQRWLISQKVEVLPVTDRGVLFNCNTPADWQLMRDQEKLGEEKIV
jgi:molybdopterin-guanine dinucleotide biosynthesis protein A